MTRKGEKYAVDVSLPEGRSQRVFVDFSRTDPSDRLVVQLLTPCGEADERQYASALKLNITIPYGAIGIALFGDTLCFVMVDTYLRRTVHPEDIAESILSLARHGDSVEKSLSEQDRY